MKSHIKRIVKDIDYGNSVVKLHLKTDGMLKVGMSTSFALIFLFLGLFFLDQF